MPRTTYDAVIIGSGIIGNSIALELARRGFRTLNVEKQKGPGLGSTGYSSGILRMMYSLPDCVKFAWEGFTYYDQWEEHIGTPCENYAQMRKCGAIILRSPSSEEYLHKVVRAYDSIGLEYHELANDQLSQKYGFSECSFGPRRMDDPLFGVPNDKGLTGGVLFPLAGYVSDPQLAAENVYAAALSTGNAQFSFSSEVVEVTQRSGRASGVRVRTGDGLVDVSSPVVINAAGPHSSHITRLAFPDPALNDMNMSTMAMRQEVAYVRAPDDVGWQHSGHEGENSGVITLDLDTGIYFRPEVGKRILVGATEPTCDEPFHEFPSEPESVYPGNEDASISQQWENQVYRLALRVPGLMLPRASESQGIAACYDVTEDWTPIYDKSALPGYYMAIGTSGNQFKNACIAGRLIAELVEACENGLDHDRDPLSLRLLRIPAEESIDTRMFSRLRAPLDTTGTVIS